VLGPSLRQAAPVPHDQLAARLQLASAAEAANLLVTAKRMFARHLRAVVGEYEKSEHDVDEEIRALMSALSAAATARAGS